MNELPKLMPGDFFSTNFPGAELGKIINVVEKFHSIDNQSECSHSGIIVNSDGLTFEALLHYKHQMIWDAYGGENTKLIIGRHKQMTPQLFKTAHSFMREKYRAKWPMSKMYKPDFTGYIGKFYPIQRLPLFFVPALARLSPFGHGVCSEVTMRHMYLCSFVNTWSKWNPDDVTDYIVRDRMIEIVYHKNITTYRKEYLDAGGETS